MIARTPGRGPYARAERERRWLLRALPQGLADPVEISDKYFPRSTLRLRRMQSGSEVVYKLGQKVRDHPDRPALVQLTNLYLTGAEFDFLGQLEGAELSKTRWRWSPGDALLAVDQFSGVLDGLVLAEVELAPDAASPSLPPLAVADVTDDERFSGGGLARVSPPEAAALLATVARLSAAPPAG